MCFDSCVSRGLVWVSYNTFCLRSCNSKWPVSKLKRKHLWLPSQTIFFNICWAQHQWKEYCFRMWSAQEWKLYQIYAVLNYWWLCGSLECAAKIWSTDRLFMFKTVFQVLPDFEWELLVKTSVFFFLLWYAESWENFSVVFSFVLQGIRIIFESHIFAI